jgi:hypothetical protein
MNRFFESVIEFSETSRSDAFVRDEKKVCSALQNALSAVYLDDGDEVDLVEQTIEALNSSHGRHFTLESMILHGNRSKVAFRYYGKEAKKELGDLLVVSTLTKGVALLDSPLSLISP